MKGWAHLLAIAAAAALGGALLLVLLAVQAGGGEWAVAGVVIALMWAPALWVVVGLARGRVAPAAGTMTGILGLRCPHCGRQAMPLARKWSLGWSGRAPCHHCGRLVGQEPLPGLLVAAPPIMALLVFAVVAGLVRGMGSWHVGATFLAGGCAVSLLLLLLWPLARMQPTDAPRGPTH